MLLPLFECRHADAVRDAVGVRLARLPISPERLWRAMQGARPA